MFSSLLPYFLDALGSESLKSRLFWHAFFGAYTLLSILCGNEDNREKYELNRLCSHETSYLYVAEKELIQIDYITVKFTISINYQT